MHVRPGKKYEAADGMLRLGTNIDSNSIMSSGPAQGLQRQSERGDMLLDSLTGLYPDFKLPEQTEVWTGLRPVTPDGPPILGRTPYRNLYLNCGQGHLGWTMACGSARVLTDLMTDRQPEIDLTGMTLERFRGAR